MPLRILASVIITTAASAVGVVVAACIPLLLGLVLPPTWGVYAMYLLSFFTAIGTTMLLLQIYERLEIFGERTLMATMLIGSFALVYVTLTQVRDFSLPQLLDVEVNAISTSDETLVQPLPFTTKPDDVVFTAETTHRTRTSRHQCTFTYAMPVCSVAQGCNEHTWLSGEVIWNIRSTENCADVGEPEWHTLADTSWLRVPPSTTVYEELVGEEGVFLTPAEQPSVSFRSIFQRLLAPLRTIAIVFGVVLLVDIVAQVVAEQKRKELSP